jgi:serine protease Do
MDAQVARRANPRLAQLLEKFVCVRAVEMEGVDLSLFQFDYDNTWLAFFLNADKTIYGRYGTRASGIADLGVDVSIEGFCKALEGALEVHAGYPAQKPSLAAKRGPPPEAKEIRAFPVFKSRFAEAPPKGCAHCHHVWEALRSVPRRAGRPLPDELMFPYPKPDRLGLTLELDERATVKSVAKDTAAARAGFAKGDRILRIAGEPILSLADVQWVLQHAPTPGDLAVDVDRSGAAAKLTLHLADDWRRGEDVTWRASTRAMRAFGWEDATPEQRRKLGIADGRLCVRVKGVPKNGIGQRAGLAVDDYVVEIEKSTDPMTENEFIVVCQQKRRQGEIVDLTVIHDGKRKAIELQAP